MKKDSVSQVIAWAVLLTLLLSACGTAATTPTAVPPAANAPATEPAATAPVATQSAPATQVPKDEVVLQVWWLGTEESDVATVKLLLDKFKEANPGITVQPTHMSWDDFTNAMPAALSAGNPPDLAFGDPTSPNTPNYVKAGQLVDLTDVAAERGWENRLSPGVMNFYSPLYGNRTYGIPLILALRGFFYNKDILKEVGGEIPQTMGDFEALLDKVKAAGYTPMLMANADKYGSDFYWQDLLFQYLGMAGEMESFKNGTFLHQPGVPWGGEAMRKAMTKFLEWRDKGYFNPDYASLITEDLYAEFAKGKAFSMMMGANQATGILDAKPPFALGFFNVPQLDPKTPVYTISDPGPVLILPKDGKHREEAIALIDFFLSQEAGEIFVNQGLVPAHKLDFAKLPMKDEYFMEVVNAAAGQVPMGWLNYIAPFEFADRQGSELQKLLAGEITLDAYLKLLQDTYDKEVTK